MKHRFEAHSSNIFQSSEALTFTRRVNLQSRFLDGGKIYLGALGTGSKETVCKATSGFIPFPALSLSFLSSREMKTVCKIDLQLGAFVKLFQSLAGTFEQTAF